MGFCTNIILSWEPFEVVKYVHTVISNAGRHSPPAVHRWEVLSRLKVIIGGFRCSFSQHMPQPTDCSQRFKALKVVDFFFSTNHLHTSLGTFGSAKLTNQTRYVMSAALYSVCHSDPTFTYRIFRLPDGCNVTTHQCPAPHAARRDALCLNAALCTLLL